MPTPANATNGENHAGRRSTAAKIGAPSVTIRRRNAIWRGKRRETATKAVSTAAAKSSLPVSDEARNASSATTASEVAPTATTAPNTLRSGVLTYAGPPQQGTPLRQDKAGRKGIFGRITRLQKPDVQEAVGRCVKRCGRVCIRPEACAAECDLGHAVAEGAAVRVHCHVHREGGFGEQAARRGLVLHDDHLFAEEDARIQAEGNVSVDRDVVRHGDVVDVPELIERDGDGD